MSQADEDKTKGKLNKYLMPENCTGLSVPNVNPEIWLTFMSRLRSTDVKLERLQNLMIKPALPVIKSRKQINDLKIKKKKKEGQKKH